MYIQGELTFFLNRKTDITISIHFLIVFQIAVQNLVETDVADIRELAIVYLRQKQKRLVQLAHVLQCLIGFYDFSHQMLIQRFVFHHHFQAVLTNGQWSLDFMRSIADELFLLFECFFAMSSKTSQNIVQFLKLSGIGIDV